MQFERGGCGHAARQATRRARPESVARAKPALEQKLIMKGGRSASHGPFDDEILGKAYDARLMVKLWAHTALYRRWVYGSMALFPATALVELAQPYLVKVAIDDHILRGDWTGLTGVAGLFLLSLGLLYALRAW